MHGQYVAPALQSFSALMQWQMTSKVAGMEGRQAILAMADSPGTREVGLVLYAFAYTGMTAAAPDSSPIRTAALYLLPWLPCVLSACMVCNVLSVLTQASSELWLCELACSFYSMYLA